MANARVLRRREQSIAHGPALTAASPLSRVFLDGAHVVVPYVQTVIWIEDACISFEELFAEGSSCRASPSPPRAENPQEAGADLLLRLGQMRVERGEVREVRGAAEQAQQPGAGVRRVEFLREA